MRTLYKLQFLVTLLTLLFLTAPTLAQSNPQTTTQITTPVEVKVEIAILSYGPSAQSAICFSTGFLDLTARETTIKINREPFPIPASSKDLFHYPFAVFTGEGDFTLNQTEIKNIRDYLNAGGFILASAGCSNGQWEKAFRREFKRIYPNRILQPIPTQHEIFHTLFEIDHLQTKNRASQAQLLGLQIEGRLALIFSPQGLNDTGNAGGGCCCCGGNEIRNAKYLNANFLTYALTK